MKRTNIITMIALTITVQASAMNLENCCCLKLFFGYSYEQKKQEYLESLKRIETLNRQSINEMLNPLSYDQLEHIKKFIEHNGIESAFPKLYSLASDAAQNKDLENTMKTLSTPPLLVMRPMTEDNIKKGFHPGMLLME